MDSAYFLLGSVLTGKPYPYEFSISIEAVHSHGKLEHFAFTVVLISSAFLPKNCA